MGAGTAGDGVSVEHKGCGLLLGVTNHGALHHRCRGWLMFAWHGAWSDAAGAEATDIASLAHAVVPSQRHSLGGRTHDDPFSTHMLRCQQHKYRRQSRKGACRNVRSCVWP